MSDQKDHDNKYKGFRCSGPTRRKGNSKDTKRWCKGVVGREHKLEWQRDPRRYWTIGLPDNEAWFDLICTVCQKQMDYCYRARRGLSMKCKCGHHDKGGK